MKLPLALHKYTKMAYEIFEDECQKTNLAIT